jgi:hypothetical protein
MALASNPRWASARSPVERLSSPADPFATGFSTTALRRRDLGCARTAIRNALI